MDNKYNFFSAINFQNYSIVKLGYRSDINGLRAIAVMAVIFYHLEPGYFPGGWLGVDIFYVISGFLITNILITQLIQNTFSFKLFIKKRIKRIIPALSFCLLTTIPFAYWLLTPKAMIEYSETLLSSLFFYSNYYFSNLDFYNSEPTKFMPLLHTWSLSIEEQFYIFFPVFLLFSFKRFRQNSFYLIFILFSTSLYLNSTTGEIIKFYYSQYRIWEILLGSMLVFTHKHLKIFLSDFIGIIFIFTSFIYFDNSLIILNSIEPKVLVCLGTAMILNSDDHGLIKKILSIKPLIYVGLISYSAYLFHQPIIAFFNIFEVRYFKLNDLYRNILILLLIVVLSSFSWKFIETPFRKFNSKLSIWILVPILIIIFLFAYLTPNFNGYDNRYKDLPEEVRFYSENINILPSQADIKNYKFKRVNCNNFVENTAYCTWFNKKSKNKIYLLGDSQTNALSVSFLTYLSDDFEDFEINFLRGRNGRCLLARQNDNLETVDECSEAAFNNFLSNLNKENDIIVAFGRFDAWISEEGKNQIDCLNCDHIEEFRNRINRLAEHSKKVFIFQPIPTYSFNISQSYLYKKNKWGEPISISLADWSSRVEEIDNFLNSLNNENIVVIPTIDLFCSFDEELCFASTQDTLYYTDATHLTLSGAKIVTDRFTDYFLGN